MDNIKFYIYICYHSCFSNNTDRIVIGTCNTLEYARKMLRKFRRLASKLGECVRNGYTYYEIKVFEEHGVGDVALVETTKGETNEKGKQ